METPSSERPDSRDSKMGEGEAEQPSVISIEGGEADQEVESQQQSGQVQEAEKMPHEIETAEVSSSKNIVNTNPDEAGVVGLRSVDTVSDAGPSSATVGVSSEEAGLRVDTEEEFSFPVNKTNAGTEAGAEPVGNIAEGDPPRQQQDAIEGLQRTSSTDVQYQTSGPFVFPRGFQLPPKSGDSHHIDIPNYVPPLRQSSKVEELDSYKKLSIARTCSNFSRTSMESGLGDRCRICQEHTEEPLIELGCRCRGDLAKAHRTCIDHWFGNKGTNKCEVCQHVATNVPPPSSQPSPNFWVWRINGMPSTRRAGAARFHPLWAALLILIAGLLFDILISIFLGASALPVNIIIGVLVVLGLGTAARLILECWHERTIRRNIRRMEEAPGLDEAALERTAVEVQPEPAQDRPASTTPADGTAVHNPAPQASPPDSTVTASVAATAAPDEVNR